MPGKIAARLTELKSNALQGRRAGRELCRSLSPATKPSYPDRSRSGTAGSSTGAAGARTTRSRTGRRQRALCGQNIVAQLQAALGDLDRVKRCVKLNVFVNSAPGFTDQPKVANGVSDFMVEVFGVPEACANPPSAWHNCHLALR